MSEPSRSRPALPWQAVVAATVLALTAAALVFVFASDGDSDSGDETANTVPIPLEPARPVGDPLEATFERVDGTTGSISSVLDGRPIVVNFFGSWCTPCVAEMPDFQRVSQELAGSVDFLGLAVDDRPEDAMRIIDETGVTYEWARDANGDVITASQVSQMPSTMFISAAGEIVDIQPGAIEADRLYELIEEHLDVSR